MSELVNNNQTNFCNLVQVTSFSLHKTCKSWHNAQIFSQVQQNEGKRRRSFAWEKVFNKFLLAVKEERRSNPETLSFNFASAAFFYLDSTLFFSRLSYSTRIAGFATKLFSGEKSFLSQLGFLILNTSFAFYSIHVMQLFMLLKGSHGFHISYDSCHKSSCFLFIIDSLSPTNTKKSFSQKEEK